jgi:phage terminase small subunit
MFEMKLTIKQERFVDYAIELGDYTNAARKAGYSEASAKDSSNWLNPNKPQYKPYLAEAIEARLAELKSEKTADLQEVLEFLTSTLRGEITDENIVVEGVGDGMSEARTMETRVPSRDRLKAAELLLKRYPRQLDEEEQIARIKKLASEADKLDTSNDTEDVIIVDDWSEVGEDAEGET